MPINLGNIDNFPGKFLGMPGIEPGVAESGSMNADHCAKITYCTKLGQQLSPSHKQCLLSFSAARVCSSLSHKPLNEYVRAIFATKKFSHIRN